MLEPSRDEKGCISYNFFADTLDSGFFHFFEEWVNQEALEKHSQSDHTQRSIQDIAQLLEKPSELRVYTVPKGELLYVTTKSTEENFNCASCALVLNSFQR